MTVRKCEDLKVWQKAMRLLEEVYAVTEVFPAKERFRLVDQLCRAAISIPSNIAEGSGRRSTKEYIRFINVAYGSLMECETQLHIASNLQYIQRQKLNDLLAITSEIARMLNALYTALKQKLVSNSIDREDPKYQILNTKSLEPI